MIRETVFALGQVDSQHSLLFIRLKVVLRLQRVLLALLELDSFTRDKFVSAALTCQAQYLRPRRKTVTWLWCTGPDHKKLLFHNEMR